MKDYDYLYALAGALAAAIAAGGALFAVAVTRALWTEPDLIGPATDQDEQRAARPPRPGEFGPDLAWPYYPFRQGRADLAEVRGNVEDNNAALWSAPRRWFFRTAVGWWWLFPVPVAILAFLLLASLVSWACFAVYAVVSVAATSVSRAALVPAAIALRSAERARRARVRTQAACTSCFHVTEWPAFECPRCRRRHHDVRPGRLGVLFRRCGCGQRLPTLASRAAWRLTPVCQRCGAPMPAGTGAVRDVRIPVFGDVSAGKTRFVYAALSSLMTSAGRAGIDVSFPDQGSREQAEFGLGVIRSGRETAKTSTNVRVSLTARLGAGRRCELVRLFDAAGEHFRTARRPDDLRFLDDGQGLVYVLDPFSVEAIRKQLGGLDAPQVRRAHAAAGDPQLTYAEVAGRLRDGGVPASNARVAVVVSKADLLASAGLALPSGSAGIAQWLRDLNVHNLVMAAERDFAEARFFMVASQDIPPGAPGDPGAPLRWLLRGQNSRLPADPSDAPERAGPAGRPGTGRPGRGEASAVPSGQAGAPR